MWYSRHPCVTACAIIGTYKEKGAFIMPVRKVKGGYQWGESGKVYPDRASAVKQGQAIVISQQKRGKK